MSNTDELREAMDDLVVRLKDCISHENKHDQEFLPRCITKVQFKQEVAQLIDTYTERKTLEARIDEWENMSWHKEHPPEFSGHESGSITMQERIDELSKQLQNKSIDGGKS